METNSTSKLINILSNKGINFEIGEKKLFKKYSYFQVINAYKNLFAIDEDSIEQIKDNINKKNRIDFYRVSFQIKSDVPDSKLYEAICNKICKKYGLDGDSLEQKEKAIKKIMYHHHFYDTKTTYGDFVRMYKFEHELRMMLLKYTLIIEECVKNIFVSHLNDIGADPNYLIVMDNYNTKYLNSKTFETMKLIIDKYDNKKSKPINRKRKQDLTVPYWMIINELAMNQTYRTITNLNEKDSYEIFMKCMNYFTGINITSETRGKSPEQNSREKGLVNNFKSLLNYLGEFRNMLAHNQPIYCYNIENFSIKSDGKTKLEFEYPKVKKNYRDKTGKKISISEQVKNLNADFMNNLKEYFGEDAFNRKNYTNLDLSKIIYILYKILKHIEPDSGFYDELKNIYIKYNIILNKNKIEISNINNYKDLSDELEKLYDYNSESDLIIDTIKSGKEYTMYIKKKNKELQEIIKNIKNISKSMKYNEVRSKYAPFKKCKRYYEFTGINFNFFEDIK